MKSIEGFNEFRRFFAGIGVHDPQLQFRLALMGATTWSSSEEMLDQARRQGLERFDIAGLAGFMHATRLRRPDLEPSGPPLVGFAFSGSYRHQLLPLAKSVHASPLFRAVAILDLREWEVRSQPDLPPFLELPTIALPDPSHMANLAGMAAIFSPDTGYRFLEFLPREVKRIALMHGIIANPEYTISHEGGGTYFDHILLPGSCALEENAILDVFPRSMVRHDSGHLELVPAGWPKLDEMIDAFSRAGGSFQRKVVVHLSVESHDSVEGMRLLPQLIETLLGETPRIEVVFRPFPGVAGGFGEAMADRFRERDGFRVSGGESYVEDYAGASVLVTLKETTAEIVSLASGIPAFCLSPETKPGEFARGRIFSSLDQILPAIHEQLDFPDRWREKIFAERDKTYRHVGTSAKAVLEALPLILAGEPVPEGSRLRLFSTDAGTDLHDAVRCLQSLALSPFFATREFASGVVAWSLARFPLDPEALLWSAMNLENISRRNQSLALGKRIGPHHLASAELFLVAHCGLLLLDRQDPSTTRGIRDRIATQTQVARQMALDLERALRTVDDYRFDALPMITAFLLDPRSEPTPLIDALEAMPTRHHNQPFHPSSLAHTIRLALKKPGSEATVGRENSRKPASGGAPGLPRAFQSLDFETFLGQCRAIAPSGQANTPELFAACLLARGAQLGTEGFLRILDDLDGEGRTAFREASRSLQSRWTREKIKVATWIHPEILASQLLPISQSLDADPRFHHAAIASGRLQPQSMEGVKSFLRDDFLYAWREEWLSELSYFDAMIGGEANIDSSGFPRHVKRFLQPHGLDAPIHHSMLHFGAGTVYDHILCPSLDERLQRELNPQLYREIIPACVQEHASAEVLAIPAGYAKLDKFCSAVAGFRGTPEKIVYHLSNWGLEHPFTRANAGRILGLLLDSFPDRKIVFRPMPKDLGHPDIVRILEGFADTPRLEVSTADSYIEDYVQAALLVHHRSSSADVFALATHRPVVLIQPPEAGNSSNPYGGIARCLEEIVPEIRRLLQTPHAPLEAGTTGQIPSPTRQGGSVAYILDCIEDASRGHRRGEWVSLPLRPTLPATSEQESLLRAGFTAFAAGVPFRAMARRMIHLHPSSRTFHLLACVGLKRDGHPDHYPEYAHTWLEALECLATGLSLPTENPTGPWEGRLIEWVGQELPEIVEVLRRRLEVESTPETHSRFQAALAKLEGLVGKQARTNPPASSPPDTDAFQLVEEGILLFESGDSAAARSRFLCAAQLAPGEGAPFIGLAHCSIREKDRAAFALARRNLSATPDGPRVLPQIDRLAREAFGSLP